MKGLSEFYFVMLGSASDAAGLSNNHYLNEEQMDRFNFFLANRDSRNKKKKIINLLVCSYFDPHSTQIGKGKWKLTGKDFL